ncbi:MAG: 7TM diverse intracellular signaling domain-containing protein [Bacteroides sp.]|nr:7TM diverse intracellular signaling domain-containing protein [Bacteroides sp.]
MKALFITVLGFAFLCFPYHLLSQDHITVYDGTSGIVTASMLNDTARIRLVLPKSPAHKAGLRYNDQIIKINDSLVSGKGISNSLLKQLLIGSANDSLRLEVKKAGEDSLLSPTLNFDYYLHQIDFHDFTYLVDSLEEWKIQDILSDSGRSPFSRPLENKCLVHSVEEGSLAARKGLMPGDRIISLTGEMDRGFESHVGMSDFEKFTSDTALTILRKGHEIQIDLNPSVKHSLQGVQSQFGHDFSQQNIWIRIETRNRITSSRSYLFNFPELPESGSLYFYEITSSGEVNERRAGMPFPKEQRDFVYKNWQAVRVHLIKDEEQCFYARLKASEPIDFPSISVIAQETIINHDRLERMVLSAFYGMMLIISLYYLILFFTTRRKQFIFFSLYILSFGLLLFTLEGFPGEYSWKNLEVYKALSNTYDFILYSVVAIFFLLLGSSYLDLRRTKIWWYRSVLILIGLILLSAVQFVFFKQVPGQVSDSLEVFTVFFWIISCVLSPLLILILPAVFRIREGFKPAWYLLIANILLGICVILSFQNTGFKFTIYKIYTPTFTSLILISAVYIASVFQFLLFSLGLARKMKLDEKEKKLAQDQVIEQLKENEKLNTKVTRELEHKVQERTMEINEQKEEIEAQRDEIEAQRDLLQEQKDMVVTQKMKITDSIDYAERIQSAVLPQQNYLARVMPEYFILFRPKDVVSGDFYWIKKVRDHLIIAVADCTGHGVPGGFMSMLGISLLNEQAGKSSFIQPGETLNQLRIKIKETLAQEGESREQKDGMDIALAVIDTQKLELKYAGAYNPLYIIRDDRKESDPSLLADLSTEGSGHQLFELKGDKQPIAIHSVETAFSTRTIQLMEGDSLYMFSDGFVDQKGGARSKKFLSKNFKNLLLDMQSLSMEEQKNKLGLTFDEWKKGMEQIDDILVMGIRI